MLPEKKQILVVDDEANLRKVLSAQLARDGYEVHTAEDGEAALAFLKEHHIDLVITDLRMPKVDGMDLLRAALRDDPSRPVVMLTGVGTVDNAVEAMKTGAFDFISKPFDQNDVRVVVKKALRTRDLASADATRDLVSAPSSPREGAARFGIIGESPPILDVYSILQRVADTPTTVLITGESGTGKELVARALHENSSRRDKPFIKVNCAAIPKDLMESELFGHEKGAFTGASARKPGRFEMAHRGTLFLDEIGDLPLTLQAKILRALEEKQFERVGGTQSLHVDVRVVAATNRNLKARVADRQFREDLYFRLSVFPVQIPPLRERTDDILTLAHHFVEKICRDVNKRTMMLSDAAVDELRAYSWPGNVRELQNCIERAVILTEGDTIQPRHLSLSFRQPSSSAPTAASATAVTAAGTSTPAGPWDQIDLTGTMADVLRRVTTEVERRKIEQALREAHGNRMAAADTLQVGFKALGTRMRQLGIPER